MFLFDNFDQSYYHLFPNVGFSHYYVIPLLDTVVIYSKINTHDANDGVPLPCA